MQLRDITLDDIESLAIGAWILGTGGGGSPYLGLLNMRHLYAEGLRVQLMQPEELADDDWIAAVSNMGAPLVGQERLTDSRTIARAVSLMEDHTGIRFRGIMSLEIGGGNSIQPMMAAAHLGRPVITATAPPVASVRRPIASRVRSASRTASGRSASSTSVPSKSRKKAMPSGLLRIGKDI